MATPAYHLRTNKAVDRFLFTDLLKRLISAGEETEYCYYGFGGPYLEDFTLIHSTFPNMDMVSVERNEEVFKRQIFHRSSSKLTLLNEDAADFISQMPSDKKAVFWLDFTGFTATHLDTYMSLLNVLPEGSIVRLTVEANPNNNINAIDSEGAKVIKGGHDKERAFRNSFSEYSGGIADFLDPAPLEYCKTIQKMIAVAAQKALPASMGGLSVHPLCSFYYKDGVGMFTHTGIISPVANFGKPLDRLLGWPHAKYSWDADVEHLEMPVLSMKERLKLQEMLPCQDTDELMEFLGYQIEGESSGRLMGQYARFYKEYPQFIRASL